ncbi:translation factor GUF1 homolog, mitochondrial-like [Clytia hemisphaerica]|uniref:Translation factor GUF1 homolog, mitochondrial n=1 Tax=Clytia hemisphaerica TaxID=252671 RepID=A0A7M5V2F8_9CNID
MLLRKKNSLRNFYQQFQISFQRHYCKNVALPLHDYLDEQIRNFCIIAHVDHGKSTLADRLLEVTGTIKKDAKNKQVLDKLQVERERGITVKAQTSSMFYKANNQKTFLYNLIDTPGHVDFSYEVSRSLAACQGALLVVDAAQGVQAQTVANFYGALDADLTILPVVNKIDLASADVESCVKQLESVFDFAPDEIQLVSAKEGIGIDKLLEAVHTIIPSPIVEMNQDVSLLLFDSWFDKYRGVVCLMAVKHGQLNVGDKLQSHFTKESYDVVEMGILHPDEVPVDTLYAGQAGYVVLGIRDVKKAILGDIYHKYGSSVDEALSERYTFKQPTPMVFAGAFPSDQSVYENMKKSIQKLTLNDASVTVHPDSSAALGQGWRLGFLGLLHMDVFKQRLAQEYDTDVIMTTPNVPYQAVLKGNEDEKITIRSPEDFPEAIQTVALYEPMITGTLIFPEQYLGKIITLCEQKRGVQLNITYIDDTRIMMKYKLPLNEVVVDFFDKLKSISSGYASFDYEESGFEETNIEKMEILLNGKSIDALSTIVHRSKVRELGKSYCFKLKNTIPRQLFEVVIQASVRNKVIARDVVKPVRKDVTAKCYGGDLTRKRKLLDRQKEGKKRMKKFGKVEVPHEVFLSLLQR